MRILLLSDPGNIHTKRWATSIAKAGHDVFVFGLNVYNIEDYSEYPNIEVKSTDYVSGLKRKHNNGSFEKIKYVKCIFELKKCIKIFKPDILHAHYASSYGLLGSLMNFYPYIISVWGSDIYDFPKKSLFHKFLIKYNFSKATLILSTSKVMATQTNIFTKKDVIVTPFGIDPNIFIKTKNKKISDNEIIIGTVKKLTPKYGINYLINAFSKVDLEIGDKYKMKLVIVGDGEEKANLEALTCKLNLANKIFFLGNIQHEMVPVILNTFDIYVALSINESFGVAIIEASACEVPVIVTKVGGLPEVVDDRHTGIVVPPRDIEESAKAIRLLVENKQMRLLMGKNGRKKVIKEYSWNENVKQMIKIYENLLKHQ